MSAQHPSPEHKAEDADQHIDQYAVVGNPITHSQSPIIHRTFAQQTQQTLNYTAIELPIESFESELRKIQQKGYKGVNVTVPFKQQAWAICDTTSARAQSAGAVNTLIFGDDGKISGDNTDGAGLTRDLINNHQARIKNSNILILGAGGAVRGVLSPLLALAPNHITIANRTLEKAQQLAEIFNSLGDIKVSPYEHLDLKAFDLIINATSAGLSQKIPPIPSQAINKNSIYYDMMYNRSAPTAFLQWAQNLGALQAFDGLGMLVEQAAESFYIWRGIHPNTTRIIQSLRQ